MVVDDQPANLKLLEDILRNRGYRVRSFPRGKHALIAALQNPPDLILLDVNMPEMDGYALRASCRVSASRRNSSTSSFRRLEHAWTSREPRKAISCTWLSASPAISSTWKSPTWSIRVRPRV